MSNELYNRNYYVAINDEWLRTNHIPDARSRYGQFDIVTQTNETRLINLLSKTSNPILHSLFATAMNFDASTDTTDSLTEYINDISDNLLGNSLADGISSLVSMDIIPDFKNDQLQMIYINESVLSLPNRHYYLNPKYKPYLDKYIDYLQRTIAKYNLPISPQKIIDVEMHLAMYAMDKDEKRNMDHIYNLYHLNDLKKIYDITPILDAFRRKYKDIGTPQKVVVTNVKLLQGLNNIPNTDDYIKWIIYNTSLPYINPETEQHHFDFYGMVINGVKTQKPRPNKAIGILNSTVGDLLGYEYSQKYFTVAVCEKINTMIDNIKQTMKQKLSNLSWMSQPTKQSAIKKLEQMKYKIGRPHKINDYNDLQLSGSLLNMMLQLSRHNIKEDLKTLGKPSDPHTWEIGAHEVNAYYSLVKNEMVFPVGILQPPFFDVDKSDEHNYGSIGTIIGHEISHAFDDQGKKFNEQGKLHDWWCPKDKIKYTEEASKMIAQFDDLEKEGYKINGKLTLGENLADLGGVLISLHTLLRVKPDANIHDFFASYASLWRQLIRKEEIAKRIKSDPHALAEFRVNQILKNVPEFIAHYNVQPHDDMYLDETLRAKIWNA
jgi:putative endopeptidase